MLNLDTVPVSALNDDPCPETVIFPVEPIAALVGIVTVIVVDAVRLWFMPDDESLLHVFVWLPKTPLEDAVPMIVEPVALTVMV